MKRLRWLIVLLLVCMMASGCAGTKQVLKDVFWPGGYVVIPSPQPGLVLPINQSPGVWAECWLFEDGFSERDIIISHPTQRGKLTFTKKPLKHFTINPPVTKPYRNGVMSTAITVPLLLSAYPADYTLLVFHQNMRGWVVRMETRRFSTTGYAFNDYYSSGRRKIYADKVIKLARVRPYERRQFKFHRTFYPGHAIKDALGLP